MYAVLDWWINGAPGLTPDAELPADGDWSKSLAAARSALEEWVEVSDDSMLDPSDIDDVVDLLSLAGKWLKERTSGGVENV